MINVHNLSILFSGEYLFQEISFRLNPGNRVGLIGKNGAGKSTILKLLSGALEPDEGSIAYAKDLKIGTLKQDLEFDYGKTVLEEAYTAFDSIQNMESRMEQINHLLAERTDYESEAYQNLIDELSEITAQYEMLDGYHYKGETEKVLLGLGFNREDFDQPTDTFSGGWRMRIELAKLLLQKNDVLLLDEPTNHLDIRSIIWFEQWLNRYTGAVVLVSHDKMFLDKVCNRTIEIVLGRIYDFNKPYSGYMDYRMEMLEQQRNAQKNQEKQIEQTEKLIERFRAKASKASMAQSLIKKLDKIERIEVDETDNAVMQLQFPVSVNPGKVVVTIDHASKNYGDKQVLDDINLLIERGSKIAFVGQNGQGKSTLAKMIVGEIPFDGQIQLGHNVQLGYFAQNQAEYLDGDKTVLETMEDAATDGNHTKVRDMLGAFLFRGDTVEKKVKVLSGGERNRLALCKMLLHPFNVLVLDEPTNHLDILSKQVLKAALQKFEGTLLLVSHDRDFLQGLSNKVYEFADRKIKLYLGDINYYLNEKKAEDFRNIEKGSPQKREKQSKKPNLSYQQQKDLKGLKNKLSKLEASISDLEKEILKMDVQLTADTTLLETQPDFFDVYQGKKQLLEDKMGEWEAISVRIDSI
ncbi:MAG: ABC-F family ATP-binding cassette domain-containing protein [Flavobacteriaceae bacterium]|nr:ABC-F family ATP-binding cassette domain-containing protein [Flavobacteriaceae bacterium]